MKSPRVGLFLYLYTKAAAIGNKFLGFPIL
jgi:hypothetical protein